MTYKVLDVEELYDPDNTEEAISSQIQDALNREEDDGWGLVTVIEQHRAWPESERYISGALAGTNVGKHVGPMFILHKD